MKKMPTTLQAADYSAAHDLPEGGARPPARPTADKVMAQLKETKVNDMLRQGRLRSAPTAA